MPDKHGVVTDWTNGESHRTNIDIFMEFEGRDLLSVKFRLMNTHLPCRPMETIRLLRLSPWGEHAAVFAYLDRVTIGRHLPKAAVAYFFK